MSGLQIWTPTKTLPEQLNLFFIHYIVNIFFIQFHCMHLKIINVKIKTVSIIKE